MKKILSCVLCLALLASFFPPAASAQTTVLSVPEKTSASQSELCIDEDTDLSCGIWLNGNPGSTLTFKKCASLGLTSAEPIDSDHYSYAPAVLTSAYGSPEGYTYTDLTISGNGTLRIDNTDVSSLRGNLRPQNAIAAKNISIVGNACLEIKMSDSGQGSTTALNAQGGNIVIDTSGTVTIDLTGISEEKECSAFSSFPTIKNASKVVIEANSAKAIFGSENPEKALEKLKAKGIIAANLKTTLDDTYAIMVLTISGEVAAPTLELANSGTMLMAADDSATAVSNSYVLNDDKPVHFAVNYELPERIRSSLKDGSWEYKIFLFDEGTIVQKPGFELTNIGLEADIALEQGHTYVLTVNLENRANGESTGIGMWKICVEAQEDTQEETHKHDYSYMKYLDNVYHYCVCENSEGYCDARVILAKHERTWNNYEHKHRFECSALGCIDYKEVPHSWCTDEYIEILPTLTEAGNIYHYCTKCGESKNENIDKLQEIKNVNLNVTEPVAGASPATTVSTTDSDIHYSLEAISWSSASGDAGKSFKADTAYTVKLTLAAEAGYVFDTATVFKINGKNAVPVSALSANGSDKVTLSLTFKLDQDEPEITYDYASGTLTGFAAGEGYTVNGKDVTPLDGTLAIDEDWYGKEIAIVQKGDDERNDSPAQKLSIPAQPAATNLSINYKAETIDTTTAVEYSTDGEQWSDCTANMNVTEFGWDGTAAEQVQFRTKATATAFAGSAQTLTIPARPAAPTNLQGRAETIDGENDGIINGTSTAMEYKKSTEEKWNACTGSTLTGLAPATYELRLQATATSFAGESTSLNIADGALPSYTLSLSAPGFDEVSYGYEQPAAKALTITSSGNRAATIASVSVAGTDFVISGGGTEVQVGASITSWLIRPEENLNAGTHTAVVTVIYNNSASATAEVSFTVNKLEQDAPTLAPEAIKQKKDCIVLKPLDANANGAQAEYSIDGKTWQTDTTFSGLNAGTEYSFYARYGATENYNASQPGPAAKISTSGGEVAYQYSITLESCTGGSVSVNKKTVAAGGTVTLNVVAESGYTLKDLQVTDKDGKEIALTEDGGVYSFTMPQGDVCVNASFSKEEKALEFVDVEEDYIFHDEIVWAVENGICTGTDSTHFEPEVSCTRAQAVTFLWRLAGCPETTSETLPFADVDADSYCYKAVQWAYEQGIVQGTSATTFSPDMLCSRAQIVTLLWREENMPQSSSTSQFTDVGSDAYYADAVLWAVSDGITNGTSENTFSPGEDCIRGQIVAFIYRLEN